MLDQNCRSGGLFESDDMTSFDLAFLRSWFVSLRVLGATGMFVDHFTGVPSCPSYVWRLHDGNDDVPIDLSFILHLHAPLGESQVNFDDESFWMVPFGLLGFSLCSHFL